MAVTTEEELAQARQSLKDAQTLLWKKDQKIISELLTKLNSKAIQDIQQAVEAAEDNLEDGWSKTNARNLLNSLTAVKSVFENELKVIQAGLDS
jgi:hypothetical protein